MDCKLAAGKEIKYQSLINFKAIEIQDKQWMDPLLAASDMPASHNTDNPLPAAMQGIARLLQANHYIIRTPAFSGQSLQGTISPFGMIRALGATAPTLEPDNKAYLGLAFD